MVERSGEETVRPGAVQEQPSRVDPTEAPERDEKTATCCIVPCTEDRDFGPIEIGDSAAHVHTLRYRDLAAVVSEVPLRIYDPARENVLAHEMVNKTVMEEYTVIPMSFDGFRSPDPTEPGLPRPSAETERT